LYDVTKDGWLSPGAGTVTEDGRKIVPDFGVAGGNGMPGQTIGIGGLGRVRLEAYTNTVGATFPGHPLQPSVVVLAPVSSPGAVALPTGLTLRIASIAGIGAPTTPTGSYALPDVTVPATATSPVTVTAVVTATNVPTAPPVVLRAAPLTGAATTATTPGLSGGTAQASLAADLTQPNVVSGEAPFQLAGWFESPIKFAGEAATTVQVAASLGRPVAGALLHGERQGGAAPRGPGAGVAALTTGRAFERSKVREFECSRAPHPSSPPLRRAQEGRGKERAGGQAFEGS
jgi:hypothetical protein